VYVEYEPNGEHYESIKMYMCQCKSGLRTVGICSHISSLVWYLGHGRYLDSIQSSTEPLENIFNNEEIDDSEDDD